MKAKEIKQPIIIYTQENLPPYTFKDKNGKIKGYAVDLVKAIMKEAKLRYRIKAIPMTEIIPALSSGECDLVPFLYDRPEYHDNFFHSYNYTWVSRSLVYRNDLIKESDFTTPRKRSKIRIGIHHLYKEIGYDLEIIHQMKKINVKSMATRYKLLLNKQCDCLLMSNYSIVYFLQKNPKMKEVLSIYKEQTSQSIPHALAINKKNSQLLKTINKSLAKLKLDGEIKKIEKKWLLLNTDIFQQELSYSLHIILIIVFLVMIVVFTLIRKIRYNKKESKEWENLMWEVLNKIPYPVEFISKNKRKPYYANQATREFIEDEPNEVQQPNLEVLNNLIHQSIKTKTFISKEIKWINKEGCYIHILANCFYLQDFDQTLVLFYDIEKYVIARQTERSASLLKSSFIANMSQDLRKPLNTIIGFSNLMQETKEKNLLKKYSEIINSNNNLLLELINNIVELSNINSGNIDHRIEWTDMNLLINQLEEQIYYEILEANKNIKLIIDRPYINYKSFTSKTNLSKIIHYLAKNAIKYTNQGYIRIGVMIYNHKKVAYIKNSGIGIPKEQLRTIFEPSNQQNYKTDGSNLGLTIIKALAKWFEIEIEVYSKENKGAIFMCYSTNKTYKIEEKENIDWEELEEEIFQYFPQLKKQTID